MKTKKKSKPCTFYCCRWCGKPINEKQYKILNKTCCEEHKRAQEIADSIFNFG